MGNHEAFIEVENLRKYFPLKGGIIRHKIGDIKAVDGISFHIKKGETLALVGETGCGKTTTGRCILRLYKSTGGKVFLEGKDINKFSSSEMRNARRNIQMIFEDPTTSLDPSKSVEYILAEPLLFHKMVRVDEYKEYVADLLRLVELEPYMAERYPLQFSGGQRQRIEIARALALKPSFIVCDNPVSQLDVSIQAQIIALLMRLQEELKLTYLFIAHDLAVVRSICDRVMVMYVGKIMEIGNTKELYGNPLHPYTQALLSAVFIPNPTIERKRKILLLPGETPSSINPPPGCRFQSRCNRAIEICREQEPELKDVGDEHQVACHLV